MKVMLFPHLILILKSSWEALLYFNKIKSCFGNNVGGDLMQGLLFEEVDMTGVSGYVGSS